MKDLAEKYFGSEEAMDISFVDPNGKAYSLDEGDQMFVDLGADANLQSVFRDGTDAINCTSYAHQVAKRFPGRTQIFGFENKDNPDCEFVLRKLHPGGHDFAIVDDRYLIDPWVRLVKGAIVDDICYDLSDAKEAATVQSLYGPRDRWTRNLAAEAH